MHGPPCRASITVLNHRTRIKICGIRRPEDALAAAAAGADAVGLVFHPAARRHVSADQARQIVDVLPAFVTPVGVFVDADVEVLRRTASAVHVRHIQLHGDEPPDYVAQLREFAVVKAVRVDPARFGDTLNAWRRAIVDLGLTNLKALVLETPGTAHPGGSGVPNDWETVRVHLARGELNGLPPVVAAGGLTRETVGGVVRGVRPYAVDVSSGVEAPDGFKSAEKIKAFIAAVRDADAGMT